MLRLWGEGQRSQYRTRFDPEQGQRRLICSRRDAASPGAGNRERTPDAQNVVWESYRKEAGWRCRVENHAHVHLERSEAFAEEVRRSRGQRKAHGHDLIGRSLEHSTVRHDDALCRFEASGPKHRVFAARAGVSDALTGPSVWSEIANTKLIDRSVGWHGVRKLSTSSRLHKVIAPICRGVDLDRSAARLKHRAHGHRDPWPVHPMERSSEGSYADGGEVERQLLGLEITALMPQGRSRLGGGPKDMKAIRNLT